MYLDFVDRSFPNSSRAIPVRQTRRLFDKNRFSLLIFTSIVPWMRSHRRLKNQGKGEKNRGGCPPYFFSLFISADAHQSLSFCLSSFPPFLSLSSLFIPTWIETVFLFFFFYFVRETRDYFVSSVSIDISNGFSRKMEGYHHYMFSRVEKKLVAQKKHSSHWRKTSNLSFLNLIFLKRLN